MGPTSPHRQKAPLAPAGGSLAQLFLATVPLLCVLIYFLIAAARRPYDEIYTVDFDDDAAYQEFLDEHGAIIGLIPMLYTFVVTFVLWCSFASYLLIFVPKRRALVERYSSASSSGSILMGNVHYRPKSKLSRTILCGCFRPEHATLTYAHPDPDSVNREMGTTYDVDDGPARRRDWLVRRNVTTYRLYTRESVPIVILPGLPLSGQARDDVEVDAATYRRNEDLAKDRIWSACKWVIFPWMAFTLLGGIFVVTRMELIDDPVDDPSKGWRILLIFVFAVMPLVALGGNYLRWRQYKNYKSNSGRVMEGDRTKRLPPPEEEELERDEGGVSMMNVCGAPSDKELGIAAVRSDDAVRYNDDESASYRSFTC